MPSEAEHDWRFSQVEREMQAHYISLYREVCALYKPYHRNPLGGLQTLSIEAKARTGHGKLNSNWHTHLSGSLGPASVMYSLLSLKTGFTELLNDSKINKQTTKTEARSVLWRNNSIIRTSIHWIFPLCLYGLYDLILNSVHKVLLLTSPFTNKEPEARSV